MDKTREARRSTTTTMAASNGVSKRRQRISENSRGHMHQELVTVRDRPVKKERDPESLNRSKRRRSERSARRNERDFGEEDSSDESHGDDDVQHNYRRKSFSSSRIPRHASAAASSLKVADEMIGVPVPRKARSACLKRSHDCRTSSGSGGVGYGEDRRRPPASPGSYSFEVASPSSSTVSVKHNKNVNGSKSRIPKPPKSAGTIEDDLEIEIAEVLSGLRKQPHGSSKREDDSEFYRKLSDVKATKKLKTEGDVSSLAAENGGLISCKARIEAGYSSSINQSTENPEKSVSFIHETHVKNGTETTKVSLVVSDIQKEKERQAQKLDSQNSSVSKGVLENKKDESNCSSKIKIDLMVPPTSPERVCPLPLVSDSIVTKDFCKQDSSKESTVKKEITPEQVKHMKAEKREWLNLDLEKPSQETAGDSSLRLQNLDWSYQPHEAKSGNQTQQSSALGGWPNGYVPAMKTDKPVSSTLMQVAPFYACQPRPKRCATHLFIARNIQLHQNLLKTNHSSQQNKAASVYPKSSDDLKPATGNPSSSPILSLNTQAQDRIIALNKESGHFALTRLKKPQPPPPGSTSIVPAQTFIFPTNKHLQPKSSRPCVASASSVNFSHPPIPNTSPNEAASSSAPYFTIIPNNAYAFQRSQEVPFYNGSFYSPQMFHRQLQQKQNQSSQRETKPSSSSSHKQPPQVTVNSHQKHRHQSENNSGSRSGPYQPQNFSMSFASPPPANLTFSTSGYHIVSAPPPVVHQKSHDSKTGATNADDHPKTSLPGTMTKGQTLVFDNPPPTLNFVSGTWPPPPTTTNNPSPHDPSPATSSQWKYHPVTSSSCNSLRTYGGETQISFAAPSKVRSKFSTSKALPLSPPPSTASQQPQDHQTENSTQKSSPVCGRTVPPIITSCPGRHLSELKY